jgi:hypothetical protein
MMFGVELYFVFWWLTNISSFVPLVCLALCCDLRDQHTWQQRSDGDGLWFFAFRRPSSHNDVVVATAQSVLPGDGLPAASAIRPVRSVVFGFGADAYWRWPIRHYSPSCCACALSLSLVLLLAM